jgi:hypothetical protein
MLGKGYLCAVVTQDAANWPTPCAMEAEKAGLFDKGQMGQSLSAMANRGELSNWPTPDTSNHRDGDVLRKDNNLEQGGFHGVSLHHAMTKYGQAAPANPSTDGSRQGLSVDWRTPQANEAGARVETLYTKDGQPARPGERAYRKTPDGRMVLQSQTINQQVEMVQNWATPIQGDSHLASTPEVAQKRIEEGKVTLSRQIAAQWATPRAGKTTDENPETWAARQAKGDVATMPLTVQVTQWITPQACHIHALSPEAAKRDMEKGNQITLRHQNPGKLNPRWVETLMGLPIGWTMPSCKSPVTIEQTSFDSSATESCLPQPSELFAF